MDTINKIEVDQADIVITGGGGSGLAAAVSAAEAGNGNINIVVLEKTKRPGGAALLPNGFFAVNSPAQKRQGIEVSGDEVYRDQIEYNVGRVNARLLRTFINKSGDIVRWIESKGLKFNSVISLGIGGPEVFHKLDQGPKGKVGEPLMKIFTRNCQDMGVRLLCETAGKKILIDKKGKVKGVLAATKDKESEILAKSIIISTGDFSASKEMLRKYLPSLMAHGEVQGHTLPHMTGDGIQMAEEAGAAIDDQFATTLVGPTYLPRGRSSSAFGNSMRLLSRRPEAVRINKNGDRYFDESAEMTPGSNALVRQPDKICYALLDSKIIQDMIQEREILSGIEKDSGEMLWLDEVDKDIRSAVDEGNIGMADSWEKIAEWIGVMPETLMTTIEQYNSYCADGYDADFLKDKKYLLPLKTPPYYAIPCGLHFESTFGGIKISHNMEVVDWQNSPIPGLYATGDNTCGLFSNNYPAKYPGFAFGFALCSGYIAGQNAAKYCISNQ